MSTRLFSCLVLSCVFAAVGCDDEDPADSGDAGAQDAGDHDAGSGDAGVSDAAQGSDSGSSEAPKGHLVVVTERESPETSFRGWEARVQQSRGAR